MSRRKRKKGNASARTRPGAGEMDAPMAGGDGGANAQDAPITQYIFTFELIRQYPTVRSFIVKQPLKRSFKDTVSDLFGGNKKGVYRI